MTRTGKLQMGEAGWSVRYPKHPTSEKIFEWKEVPLVPEDQEKINQMTSSPNPISGVEVEFELIDEFSHPQYYENVGWGDGVELAKLVL